jgi:hypothetical protein
VDQCHLRVPHRPFRQDFSEAAQIAARACRFVSRTGTLKIRPCCSWKKPSSDTVERVPIVPNERQFPHRQVRYATRCRQLLDRH